MLVFLRWFPAIADRMRLDSDRAGVTGLQVGGVQGGDGEGVCGGEVAILNTPSAGSQPSDVSTTPPAGDLPLVTSTNPFCSTPCKNDVEHDVTVSPIRHQSPPPGLCDVTMTSSPLRTPKTCILSHYRPLSGASLRFRSASSPDKFEKSENLGVGETRLNDVILTRNPISRVGVSRTKPGFPSPGLKMSPEGLASPSRIAVEEKFEKLGLGERRLSDVILSNKDTTGGVGLSRTKVNLEEKFDKLGLRERRFSDVSLTKDPTYGGVGVSRNKSEFPSYTQKLSKNHTLTALKSVSEMTGDVKAVIRAPSPGGHCPRPVYKEGLTAGNQRPLHLEGLTLCHKPPGHQGTGHQGSRRTQSLRARSRRRAPDQVRIRR